MNKARPDGPVRRLACGSTALAAIGLTAALAAPAHAADPIRIAVIAENSAIGGIAITQGARIAAAEINAAGGVDGRKIELVEYDDHNSATDAVRAFQRAASQDHVVAVIASYMSEVALALIPWSARLKMPFITPGASSNEITRRIHNDYEHNKYAFHGYMTSSAIATAVCEFSHDVLVTEFGMKTTVIMSEDAAWTKPLDQTYQECLPKAGLKVLDQVVFTPDTTDFTPIFNGLEGKHPDVITTGISHVGVQPTVQWRQQQVPVAMSGVSSQATTDTFWRDTNGAAEGVIAEVDAAPNVAVTARTIPFAEAYAKAFNTTPGYAGYTAADDVHLIAEAVKRAGSTESDKLVEAMEKTDMVGTIGRIAFYGPKDEFTHGLRYGQDYTSGIVVQWQDGKQVAVWPKKVAAGTVRFPSFVKLPEKQASR